MKKFWYGVLAFAPIVSMIGYFVVFALIMLAIFVLGMAGVLNDNLWSSIAALVMIVWMWLGIFIVVVTDIADMVVFTVLAVKNPQLDATAKGLWCGSFFTFQMVAFPIYWWTYIRKSQ